MQRGRCAQRFVFRARRFQVDASRRSKRSTAAIDAFADFHHYAVNNFRIVFSCLGNTRIKLLEDRAYYFYYCDQRVGAIRSDLLE